MSTKVRARYRVLSQVAVVGDRVESAVGTFWLEGGLLRFVAHEGTAQTGADAEGAMRVFAELGAGVRRPAVMVITGVRSLSREARALYTGSLAAETFAAVALVVAASPVARALVNFVTAVSRPSFPTRMFGTVEDALTWAAAHKLTD